MPMNPPLPIGHEVSVIVEADSAGDVAVEGKGVHPKTEEDRSLVVELVEPGDFGLGILKDDPEDWTGSQSDFSADDRAGKATMYLGYPVFNAEADSGYTPSLGDYVDMIDGGVVDSVTGPTATSVGTVTNALGHDGSTPASLETEAGSDTEIDLRDMFPWGRVVATHATEFNVGSSFIAVARTGPR